MVKVYNVNMAVNASASIVQPLYQLVSRASATWHGNLSSRTTNSSKLPNQKNKKKNKVETAREFMSLAFENFCEQSRRSRRVINSKNRFRHDQVRIGFHLDRDAVIAGAIEQVVAIHRMKRRLSILIEPLPRKVNGPVEVVPTVMRWSDDVG